MSLSPPPSKPTTPPCRSSSVSHRQWPQTLSCQDSHPQKRTDRHSRAESINFTDEHLPRFPGAFDSTIASVEDGAGNNRPEEEELDQTLLDITAGHQLNLNSLILDIMQSKTDNVLDDSRLDLTAFGANDFA